ncbi:hypothetical protein ABZ616_36550 [Streptomyces noursei]|uniref:hypothetical protein n=1 Tax=Streptomyces noursei TaxID=1971 RepID=UPI0033F87BAC
MPKMVDGFWKLIDVQLKELESAKGADDVIRILGSELCVGDGFFHGSGGDETVYDALLAAGWSFLWSEAEYYYAMQAPDGSAITYIEGDIYRGNRR